MLTLTRKVGETIRIGDDIEVVVKEIRKNQVRIGIVAPREVKIYREEVYENILAERRAKAAEEEAEERGQPGSKSARNGGAKKKGDVNNGGKRAKAKP